MTFQQSKPGNKPVAFYFHDELDTGILNANGDYSSAEKKFIVGPSDTEIWLISQVIITIIDGVVTNAKDYGGIANGLANGLTIGLYKNDILISNLIGQLPIKTNGDFKAVATGGVTETSDVGDDYRTASFSFIGAGKPFPLDAQKGHKLAITLNDDLEDLTKHLFTAFGYVKNRRYW